MPAPVPCINDLTAPVAQLRGVGPSLATKLARLQIHTVGDVLFHLPLRYQDRTRLAPIGSLRQGQEVLIEASVELAEITFGRRRSLLCRVSDNTGWLTLRFFHFSAAQRAALSRGARLRCFGEVRAGPSGLEMVHPEYQHIAETPPPLAAAWTAIYPTTEGVGQPRLRALVQQALDTLVAAPEVLPDWLPEPLRRRLDLVSLSEALQRLHQPGPQDGADAGAQFEQMRRRLAFEELLAHQLSLRQLRVRLRARPAAPLHAPRTLRERFFAQLGFAPTAAQQRVMTELSEDLAEPAPMMRLVQGDVGSGKTVIAAFAALTAQASGLQTALMAPTELLAEQHLRTLRQWLEPLGVTVDWLTGRLPAAQRATIIDAVERGRLDVVVGTHALFQEAIRFARLGLVIVDEQHRFGVHQRLNLREKGTVGGRAPHQLVMTATPIPRTLSMSAYADLDVSVIDELPPGRRPVKTSVLPESRRPQVLQRVGEAVRAGRQAYWICTLIEESEQLQARNASETAAALAEALPEIQVGLVHGRMNGAAKERVMNAFKRGEVDLLVATTVVEVGVDVPNAALMIVENAERLGLAQLHQLRGRVGRGERQSHCVLFYKAPLGASAKQRLRIMRETNDGFEIARRDLELRGPGEVLGTRQTGLLQMRVADLLRDQHLLPHVRRAAEHMLGADHAAVKALIRRWLPDHERLGSV